MKQKYTNKRIPLEFLYSEQKVKNGEYASSTNREIIKFLREIINDDLTKTQKQYIIMYYMNNMKIREIALEFGVNKSTVSRTIQRAKKRIFERLKYTHFRSFIDDEHTDFRFFK